jgi:hypothetical protein
MFELEIYPRIVSWEVFPEMMQLCMHLVTKI